VTHQAGAYHGFCGMKRLEVFLSPGWDGCWPIAMLPQTLNSPVPIVTLDVVRHYESKVEVQEHNA